MKKIAIFVEGQTEQLFVEELLLQLAGRNCVQVVRQQASGGSPRNPRRIVTLSASVSEEALFQATIVDCGNDSRVASDLRDNYGSLVASGFTRIIGIRDVRPSYSRAQLPDLRRLMGYGVKTKPVVPDFVLVVMEIEAWFLAEASHFGRLSPPVDLTTTVHPQGEDPRVDDMTLVDEPAALLDRLYRTAGLSYTKSKACVSGTVGAIDFDELCLATVSRDSSLQSLVGILDGFLAS